MDSFEFDNIKAEKEDASWRYNMERKLKFGLRLIGFLMFLFLLSWSWFLTSIPDIIEVAGNLRRRFISTLTEPFLIFIVINIIILVVYVLSSQKQTQKQSTSTDIYDEYVSSHRSITPTSAVATAVEATMVDKQIVPVENAVADTVTKRSLSPLKQQPPSTTTPTVTKTKPVINSTDKVEQKEYRRTRSVVSESRNQRPRLEFRRSEGETIGRELVISTTEPPRKSIDEMSSEEFQLIIDSFIAERRKTLMQENIAHYTKGKFMSVVVKN